MKLEEYMLIMCVQNIINENEYRDLLISSTVSFFPTASGWVEVG